MQYFGWTSIAFYCLFTIFVFYQQLHARDFRGASQAFGLILSLFAFAGMLTGLGYLIYYGWSVTWWVPIPIFIIGLLASFLGFLIERLVGKFTLSMLGFIGWPACAYFMFAFVPHGT